MLKVSFSDGLALAGIVLALHIVVLDKADKLKPGPMLILLLILAWLMTLPLSLGNPWVADTAGIARLARSLLTVSLSVAVFSLIGLWIMPPPVPPGRHGIMATASTATYPSGTVIAGIPWSKRFTDLRVSIFNSGPLDWEDIEVTILPDQPVVAVGQVTSVPDTSLSASSGTDITFRMELVQDGKRVAVPLVLVATTTGYRMQCRKLSRRQRIEVALALAALPEYSTGPPAHPRADFGVFDRAYAVRLKQDNGLSNWYGHGSDVQGRIEDIYLDNAPMPKTVRVDGKYLSEGTEHLISEAVEVHDLIEEVIPVIQEQIRHSNDVQPKHSSR